MMTTPATPPNSYHRPSLQARSIRRSFTQPPRSLSFHERAGLDPSDAAAEILYTHPNAHIVAFTPPIHAVRSVSTPASYEYDYPVDTIGTLPWAATNETVLASGALTIEKVRGSTNFLKSGTKSLHALMRNSQCWCVDDEATLVMRVRTLEYYRIVLPYVTNADKTKVEELKDLLKRILRFETTPCPFKRGFHVDLPASATTPRKRAPWTRKPGSLLPSPPGSPSPALEIKRARGRTAEDDKVQQPASYFPLLATANRKRVISDGGEEVTRQAAKDQHGATKENYSDNSTDPDDTYREYLSMAGTRTMVPVDELEDPGSTAANELLVKDTSQQPSNQESQEGGDDNGQHRQPCRIQDIYPVFVSSREDEDSEEEVEEEAEGRKEEMEGGGWGVGKIEKVEKGNTIGKSRLKEWKGVGGVGGEEGLADDEGPARKASVKGVLEEEIKVETHKDRGDSDDNNNDCGECDEELRSRITQLTDTVFGPHDRPDQSGQDCENGSRQEPCASISDDVNSNGTKHTNCGILEDNGQDQDSNTLQGTTRKALGTLGAPEITQGILVDRAREQLLCPDVFGTDSNRRLPSLAAHPGDDSSSESVHSNSATEMVKIPTGSDGIPPEAEPQHSETASISSCADSFHSLVSQERDLGGEELGFAELAEPSLPGAFETNVILPLRHRRDVSEITITREEIQLVETNGATSLSYPPKPESEDSTVSSLGHFKSCTSSSRSPQGNQLAGAMLLRAGHLALEKPVEVVVMLVHILARIAGGATFDDLMNGDLFRRPNIRGRGHTQVQNVPNSGEPRMGEEVSDDEDSGVWTSGRSAATTPCPARTEEDLEYNSDLD